MSSTSFNCALLGTAAAGALASALLLNPTPALAQSGSSTSASRTNEAAASVEEIVVTAQKRVERLIDVPVAVTAVSGDALASQQINDTQSLARAAPSLTFVQGNNPGNSSFRIRGIGTALFSQGTESDVTIVVDGVAASRQAQGFSDLADIERVEVLRGPQGTLFGANAIAGAINVTTAAPSDTFGGRVDATIAEGDEYRLKGTISGPITETLRARLSAYYNDVGGNLHNVTTGKDVNGSRSVGVRGKLQWTPTDKLDVLLIGQYGEIYANCCSRVPVRITTPAVATLIAPVAASPENRNVANDNGSYSDIDSSQFSLQWNYDLGFATITSISAIQRFTQWDQFEPDQIPSDPVRFVGPFAFSQWNLNRSQTSLRDVSQEFRIASNGEQRISYVAGVAYDQLEINRSLQRRRARCGAGVIGQPCTVPLTHDSSGFAGKLTGDSYAVFGQLDANVAGGLHALAGLRWQHLKQTSSGFLYAPLVAGDAAFPGITVNSGSRSRSDSALTGKAGLRYEFNRNANLYATYTKGYKAFALDIDASTDFANQTGINPEHVKAYEVGFKWRGLDGRLDVNAAIFRMDYTDLQVQAIFSDPTTGVFIAKLINAGEARSQGVEVESTFRATEEFQLAASVNYLDATIDVPGQTCPLQFQAAAPVLTSSFPSNACYRASSRTPGGATVVSSPIIDVVGGRLPAAPRWRVSLSPRWDHDLESRNLTVFAQANFYYNSKQWFSLSQDPLLVQKAYTTVDVSVGVRDADNRWSLTGFVRNLFDQNYYNNLQHGTILATPANPNDLWANVPKDADRYFGVNLGYRF